MKSTLNNSNRAIIATHNSHKTKELSQELGKFFTSINDLNELEIDSIEETGKTFADNAKLKAKHGTRNFPQHFIIADDSGLSVDALNGAPGIYSARFAGKSATDAENRQKLLEQMSGIKLSERTASFICVIALAVPKISSEETDYGNSIKIFEGKISGKISVAESGQGGFGYDSIFIPDGDNCTFAEMPANEKNKISHRAIALKKLIDYLSRN